jgi:hypothetical protein
MMQIQVFTTQTIQSLHYFARDISEAANKAVKAAVDAGVQDAKATKLFDDGVKPRRLFTRDSIRGVNISPQNMMIVAGGATNWLNWGTRDNRVEISPPVGTLFSPTPVANMFKETGRRGINPRFFMNIARDMAQKTLEYGIEHYINAVIK